MTPPPQSRAPARPLVGRAPPPHLIKKPTITLNKFHQANSMRPASPLDGAGAGAGKDLHKPRVDLSKNSIQS